MSKPETYPDIIYKYRNWKTESNKNVLLKNELFMTSPEYFNDPFDCRIPTNYNLLDTPKKIEQYAVEFVNRHKVWLLQNDYNLEKEIESIKDDYTNRLEKMQLNHENDLFVKQNIHYGILSMSSRWNSILMWSHYAEFHKGYCAGFWEDKMRESGLFGKGGPVTYNPENDYPEINPLKEYKPMIKGFIETNTKANDWSYENEYRLFNLYFPEIPTKEDRKIIVPDEFFAEIIIGIMTSEEDRTEIIELALKKGIKVYQAKKVPFKFEITKEEIK